MKQHRSRIRINSSSRLKGKELCKNKPNCFVSEIGFPLATPHTASLNYTIMIPDSRSYVTLIEMVVDEALVIFQTWEIFHIKSIVINADRVKVTSCLRLFSFPEILQLF